MVALAALAAATVILLPLTRAWARRLSGADPARIAELEQRVEDLERLGAGDMGALEGQLSDLHERLDFTERLLAQARMSPGPAPAYRTDETTGVSPTPAGGPEAG